MESNKPVLTELARTSRRGVMVTHRKDGGLQTSIVTPVADPEGRILIWARSGTAKAYNLARDPRAAVCIAKDSWSGWVNVEGKVEIFRLPEAMPMLENYYRFREGAEHPNWDEYRATMIKEGRVLLVLTPDRVSGPPAR